MAKPRRAVSALLAALLLAACAAGPPVPEIGAVNAEAGGVPLEADPVPPEAVAAFAPFAWRFVTAYGETGGDYNASLAATLPGSGFVPLGRAGLEAAFFGLTRRHFYLDVPGGATNHYTREPAGRVGEGPAWRLLSTGGDRYDRYGFAERDGLARLCMSGRSARCGVVFADGEGTLGVIWERAEGGVVGWVYGPPAPRPAEASQVPIAATPAAPPVEQPAEPAAADDGWSWLW